MKKIIYLLFAVSATLGFYSCSDDFEVSAPYKNITLVYGLLNMNDTAHYVKIQKAFLDEKKSAIEMAKVPDSSYYPNLTVVVKEINGGNVIKTIPLQRVDVNLEGHVKDTGAFFTSPNYAYKFKETLNPNSRYRLVITNPSANGGFVDSSEIQVLDASQVNADIMKNTLVVLTPTIPIASKRYSVPVNLPATVKYLEGRIKFRWTEKNITTNVSVDREADFAYKSIKSPRDLEILTSENINFYSFLKSSMGVADPNIHRFMDSCQIFVAAGAEELLNYIRITEIQSGGLTADQLKPLYTNILGKDVYGLFSSRTYKVYENIPISDATIDSFKIHPITADLNIRGRSDH